MSLPGVSCLCPTYGRPPGHLHLLEEAVESFVRQDYAGPKELLVLNDHPSQRLACAAPGVRVVNVAERLPTLGGKYNAMVRLAAYDLLCPFEDDDLSLPGRLTQAVACLGGDSYWVPGYVWFLAGGAPHHAHEQGCTHHAGVFTRAAWRAVGGYPPVSGAQDKGMDGRLRALPTAPALCRDPRDWQYVYRWGVSPVHLSGRRDCDDAYREWGDRPADPGRYEIAPRWRQDYQRLLEEALTHG